MAEGTVILCENCGARNFLAVRCRSCGQMASLWKSNFAPPAITCSALLGELEAALGSIKDLAERGRKIDEMIGWHLDCAAVEIQKALDYRPASSPTAEVSHVEQTLELPTMVERRAHPPLVSTDLLGFDDAVRIARGCFDYSGGHRERELEIYHHGIQTVLNALEAAAKAGLNDTQVTAVVENGKPEA